MNKLFTADRGCLADDVKADMTFPKFVLTDFKFGNFTQIADIDWNRAAQVTSWLRTSFTVIFLNFYCLV